MKETQLTIIGPKKGWGLRDLQELKDYRDLFYFLVWRDIKALYAQTIMGFSWAILQPLIQIILFTIIFGRVARIPTDGIPYFLFSSVAIIPWTYMSTAMNDSSMSLVSNQSMLGKVYFPRIIYPLISILAKLIDFVIALLIIVAVLVVYRVTPTVTLLYLPVFIFLMIMVPVGVGFWLSSLAIRFRDVKFAMRFLVQMLMYTAPIVYATTSIPENYRFWYAINPIVGVIEGFRSCLLGLPIHWEYIFPGAVISLVVVGTGALYFTHMERVIADVI